jgi:hypothetical protein
MATLAEIRAKLKEQETRSNNSNTPGDSAIYPFWNMKEGAQSTIRFLPDGNPSNTFFWVERALIKLPFAGIKGQTDSRPVQVQVPCMEMYGETCPVLTEVRPWFKDPTLEDMGRKYWKKRSYLFQGLVTENALSEETPPENPIRRFIIGPQVFQLIKAALMDPEVENLPTDFVSGLDFRLVKGQKGGYADYSTSSWARRERPLSDAEMQAINTYTLPDLSSFLPKKPTEVELKVIKEMFEASVDGEAYDPDRWGQYYKPAGVGSQTGNPAAASATAATSTVAADPMDDEPPFATAPAPKPAASGGAQDILAMIRARQTQQ